MDNTEELTHLSLCAGYGGIDLGLKRVIPNLRTVALCEVEAYACANLVAKMEAGLMDAAPIWSNLKTFPWSDFRDRVGILSGGYPCTPFSAAGKRLGAEDERHLWPFIANGIRILRPRICFFENVEGHITLGLSTVISDLEELGYKVSWGIFSAAEVGAPHQRKRVFIMAHRCGEGLEGHGGLLARCSEPRWDTPQSQGQVDGGDSVGDAGGCWDKPDLADSDVQHGHGAVGRGNCAAEGVSREHRSEEHTGWQSWRADAPSLWPSRPGDVGDTTGGYGEGPGLSLRPRKGQLGGAGRCNGAWPSRPGELQHWWEPPRVVGDTEHSRLERQRNNATSKHWRDEGIQLGAANGNNSDAGQAESEVGGGVDGASNWVGYGELCVSSDNRTDELRMLGNGVCVPTVAKAFLTLINELL